MHSDRLPGNFTPFDVPLPASAAEWEARKGELRRTLRELLGETPPLFTPQPRIVERQAGEGYTRERIEFDNGAGATVYGFLLVPTGRTQPGPAILYHHYHGGHYDLGKDEFLQPNALGEPKGPALARAGYVVLSIDAYAFGDRQHQGPAGEREKGGQTELSLFKQFLWQGRTLWGMMVRDDTLALNYLLSRPEVDPARVGAMGMSMGSTRSWWLAALDERIKATVAVACLTRYQNLLRHGDVFEHGIYYFVPGILARGIDMEALIGCIAPRALLTLTGAVDGGSPVDGVEQINAFLRQVYARYGADDRFEGVVYPGEGHVFNADMWRRMQAWFARQL